MKHTIYPILALLLFIGCKDNKKGVLEITVDYHQKVKWASDQYAIWVEDADGNYMNTIFVTKYSTTKQAYTERPDCIPVWVSKANPASMDNTQIDAISGATPDSGIYTYTWDLKDKNGKQVPAGTYTFVLEATLDGGSRVIFKNNIEIGKAPVTVEAIPEYTQPEHEKNKDMIGAVTARYKLIQNTL